MAWVPVVIASQGGNLNSSKKRIVIAVIVLLLLGAIVLFAQLGIFNYMPSFPPFLVTGLIIFCAIFGITIAAISSTSRYRQNRNPYPSQYGDQGYHVVNQNVEYQPQHENNPAEHYKLDSIMQSESKIRYCSYCGCYLSQDAVYCPECGKRIE